MSTYGAMDGGIIYVQGQGEACKQPTKSGMAMHEFDFEQCGIQWVRILFDLILYVPSTIFQLNRDGSSWVEPVLS